MKEKLYGRKSADKKVVLLYTAKSNRLFNVSRWVLLILLAPVWLPFYIFIHIGIWSEILLEKADDALEWLLQKVIPRSL